MLKVKGLELKIALQKESIKLKDAADRLNISRQTLINWYAKERLSEDILTLVKERLGIDLRDGGEDTDPVKELLNSKDKIITILESKIEDKDKIIRLLEAKDK